MNRDLSTGAVTVLNQLQRISDRIEVERLAVRVPNEHEIWAEVCKAAHVDVRPPEDYNTISPIGALVETWAPAIQHWELGPNAETLTLYGPKITDAITLPLDDSYRYFEMAWAAGALDELLPESLAGELRLLDATTRLSTLSLMRERGL